MVASNIIAVIFDFDDTLTPDSTTKLIEKYGVDPQKFWLEDAKRLVNDGWDPTHAYLRLIIDRIGSDKPFDLLTNENLRSFGSTLQFYPGIPRLFNILKKIAEKSKCEIEFYVVTGGLQEIVEGSNIRQYLSGVWGCQLEGDNPDSELKYIKRCVTFTEKTRYLFEINKGLRANQIATNPYLVNKEIQKENRRVPFENMIYIGDGLTDIPCFSLIKNMSGNQGTTFGIFNPAEEGSAKKALLELLKTDRVISAHAPRYRKTDELGSLLRAAVATRCSKINLVREEAERR